MRVICPLVAVLLPLTIYVATTARDIMVGDNPEFVATALLLGVAHPPGYPLVTILGHLFSLLPLGPDVFRVNLVSAVCGAATSGVVYFTAMLLVRRPSLALGAALLLAFHPLFWAWSLEAEAFPLNNLLSALLIYFLLRWDHEPKRAGLLAAASLMAGLGLSNHQTIVFLGPAVLFVLWRRRRELLLRPKVIGMCAIALLSGLLPYAYVPWAAARDPYVSWGDVSSIGDLIRLFLRQDYGTGQLQAGSVSGGAPIQRVMALFQSFTAPEALLLVAGFVQGFRQRGWAGVFFALTFAVAGLGFVIYANIDVAQPGKAWVLERFFLLPHVALAPFAAMGLLAISSWLTSRSQKWTALAGNVALLAAMAATIVALLVLNYRAVDVSGNRVARTYAEDLLASVPEGAVLLLGSDDKVFPVEYLLGVERARPDVRLIIYGVFKSVSSPWYIRHLKRHAPDISIPFDQFDGHTIPAEVFLDANRSRPLITADGINLTLGNRYWFYETGLVVKILPQEVQVFADQAAADLEKLLPLYHPPLQTAVRARTFEGHYPEAYALPAFNIGRAYEATGNRSAARTWYQRALDIFPAYKDASKALQNLQ